VCPARRGERGPIAIPTPSSAAAPDNVPSRPPARDAKHEHGRGRRQRALRPPARDAKHEHGRGRRQRASRPPERDAKHEHGRGRRQRALRRCAAVAKHEHGRGVARDPSERTRRASTRPDSPLLAADVRVTPATRDRLNALARRRGASAHDVIEELVRGADDRALLADAEACWRRLASNPAALTAYRHETRALTAFDAQPQGE
jgi:hypothetical protein